MKKIAGVIVLVLGVIATGIGTVSLINIKSKAASSVAIIGGADMPVNSGAVDSEKTQDRKAKSAIQWDCSVACAEASNPDKYVITYSDVKVLSQTGVFTVQNRNDFDIKVYLHCAEETVRESETIPAGGCYSFMNVSSKEYTVGIHADVDMNTEIKVFVYDGKDTEPYTK